MFINTKGLVFNDGASLLGGQGQGRVGQALNRIHFDTGLMRPYLNERDQPRVTVNTGQSVFDKKKNRMVPVYKEVSPFELRRKGIDAPVANALSLTRNEWIQIQTRVRTMFRQTLRAWQDLSNVSSIAGFDAYSKATYEYEVMSEAGEVIMDMDSMTEGRVDELMFKIRSTPLPIMHANFWFSDRHLAMSRNSGTPLSTRMAEQCARRIAEMAENLLVGSQLGMTYGTQTAGPWAHEGTSTIYGYTTFPYRNIKTDLHTPDATRPDYIIEDVLEMIETLQTDGFPGPYVLYHSTAYSRFLNDDYFRAGGTSVNRSTRERLLATAELSDIRRLNFWTPTSPSPYQLVLIQLDSNVAAALNGMPITTIQWDAKGGMQKMFKVMAIMVPLLFADYNGNCGIVHGTTA